LLLPGGWENSVPDRNGSALVCLSGGVDSTASLLRSTEQFGSVRAVYVDTLGRGAPESATQCCRKLGIELNVIPAAEEFKSEVMDVTRKSYGLGQTPNPCALCNARVKLALPSAMLREGEVLVTGHYAWNDNGTLRRGKDPSKDQSYFLSLVPVHILKKCRFPLSHSMKVDVRREVIERDLPFIARESQDLCFKLDGTGTPGDIVDVNGETVGMHNGLDGYTPGQRKGLGAYGARKFVVELDHSGNRLVIGDEEFLYSDLCILDNINWVQELKEHRFSCLVQIRYRKAASYADVVLDEGSQSASVFFHSPQKAMAPGQVGALYFSDSVLGGGIIGKHERN
jgi:tRNA-specific 2-thiouridylase